LHSRCALASRRKAVSRPKCIGPAPREASRAFKARVRAQGRVR
jgi:hypothetical protein